MLEPDLVTCAPSSAVRYAPGRSSERSSVCGRFTPKCPAPLLKCPRSHDGNFQSPYWRASIVMRYGIGAVWHEVEQIEKDLLAPS